MAHWTITVSGVAGAAQLEDVFGVCARLRVDVHSARFSGDRVRLELAPAAPLEQLEDHLLRSGFRTRTEPGDHSLEALSVREQELLSHLAGGLQLKEVARRMGVETSTVREYWSRVKRKLGVRSMSQAASLWTTTAHTHDDGEGPG
jgi:DNA-binding CsgD family transcriptional regulator